ncbi:DUF6039 family protein [Kitasatospora sp. NBC_01560]|uniref:DUF6039 family protein n=1 Tax=Kitasatospora sp. NBC_01560 TaxID=2975965 RepID=UPI00386DB843
MTDEKPKDRVPALHSANSGFTVHRTGQLEYGFATEGGEFASDLVRYLNNAQGDLIGTYVFKEVLGVRDRLHWFVHLKSPHDYQRLLKMVDHDREYQDISTLDRLPAKGGGNWERMFMPGTFSERILCPQHGVGHPPEGAVDPAAMFTDPAVYQTSQPADIQLTTATAGAIVLRTAKARYTLRDQARYYGVEWSEYVNTALPGDATAFLYEEIFGHQDTLHWLLHLRSLDVYEKVEALAGEAGYQELHAKKRVPDTHGGGGWGDLFVPGSMQDTVLVPFTPTAG